MRLLAGLFIVTQLLTLNAFAEQELEIEKVFKGEFDTNEEAAKLIVELIKKTELKKDYERQMNEAFDFLDDEWRTDLASVNNLDVFKLSQWTPTSYFRMGQGDYEFCDIDKEVAAYHYQTQLVGFDTSYKRENTFGFWGNFSVNLDWCEGELEENTRSRLRVKFNKWIDAATVESLLF